MHASISCTTLHYIFKSFSDRIYHHFSDRIYHHFSDRIYHHFSDRIYHHLHVHISNAKERVTGVLSAATVNVTQTNVSVYCMYSIKKDPDTVNADPPAMSVSDLRNVC